MSISVHVLIKEPAGFRLENRNHINRLDKVLNRQDTEKLVCYEFAEFEFSETIKLVSLEHLHFSQRREIFDRLA